MVCSKPSNHMHAHGKGRAVGIIRSCTLLSQDSHFALMSNPSCQQQCAEQHRTGCSVAMASCLSSTINVSRNSTRNVRAVEVMAAATASAAAAAAAVVTAAAVTSSQYQWPSGSGSPFFSERPYGLRPRCCSSIAAQPMPTLHV